MINLPHATEALARRLAAARSVPVEDAVREALEYRANAVGIPLEPPSGADSSPEAVKRRKTQTDAIVSRIAALPILDSRSPREIMDDLDPL